MAWIHRITRWFATLIRNMASIGNDSDSGGVLAPDLSDDLPVAETAATRVFATPEILGKILSNLDIIEILKFQQVNTTFNNIFTIAPHLLRTMGVQKVLPKGNPSDHYQDFLPLVIGLKKKELLIRPYEFLGVRRDPISNKQKLPFYLNMDMASYHKSQRTIMGRAGKSGKDYNATYSWSKIALATSPFILEIIRVARSGPNYHITVTTHPGVTTVRTLFGLLEAAWEYSMAHEESGQIDELSVLHVAVS